MKVERAAKGEQAVKDRLAKLFPILTWGRTYDRAALGSDLMAAVIVTIMLIPQSLAYAMLAGLKPEAGLYASVLPILLYALFGSSRALAVGPVAVVSMMTAAAVADASAKGLASPEQAALTLAALSGGMLFGMGTLRAGFVANFLSHPVIAGFIAASGILIAVSQIGPLTGIKVEGQGLVPQLLSLAAQWQQVKPATFGIGLVALLFLFWVRRGMKPALQSLGLSARSAEMLTKAGPVLAVAVSTALVWGLALDQSGVAVVGAVPQSLPPLTWPPLSLPLVKELVMPAALISLIGFVESVSVAQTLAAKRRQRIDPDQELIGLGAANIGAALTGGFPVTGGFARSVVNFDAGAATPAAGAFTAIGLAMAALFLTPFIAFLPKATLAATIIVAVLGLVDLSILRKAWNYSRGDFACVLATILVTLGFGVEAGVTAGVGLSLVLFLYRSSRPHVAEVGLVEGSEHFRNVLRHRVQTHPSLLTLRVDRSLYFANARHLEEVILSRTSADPAIRHVVLMCSAVNEIDLSALETLEALNTRLAASGIGFHLSEVKGPVMDRLSKTHLIAHLHGRVFLSQFEAFCTLTEACKGRAMEAA